MKITEQTWVEYIDRLARLNQKAGEKMAEYIAVYGTHDTAAVVSYAAALVEKYGEGSAELACQMYDAVAQASGVTVPPAAPASPAGYAETAKMVNGTLQSPPLLRGGVSRLVKQAGADTTLKNAIRDGAQWAWVPHGDSCPFCIMLASRGWQKASKKVLKGDHAQHIHAHCNCEFAVRFNRRTTVAGYDPDKYLAQYRQQGGDLNAMRRAQYEKNKKIITAQKRAAYAAKRLEDIEIGQSVGAKAKNYIVIDKSTGQEYYFVEGTRLQNAQVFAGKGGTKPLREEVSKGLAEEFGGSPDEWQHCKAKGWLDVDGEQIRAEVHWFQNGSTKVKFKVKKWLYDED